MTRLAAPLLCALLLAACGGKEEEGGGRGRPPTSVRVAAAIRMDVPVSVTASGVVDPVETVAVQSQVSGTLQRVAFREGDYVRAGQVLFQVDPRPLQAAVIQARAVLMRSEAQAEAARRSDARYQALVRQDYVAREQADQIHAAALAADATVMADRAALAAARVNLGYATIRAPISGRTGGLLARAGNIVGPQSGPLVVINQLQPALVRFPILSGDLPLLQNAIASRPLPVTVTLSDSNRVVEVGELAFLDNAVDSLTGTLTGKATLQNRANRFWPGQLVFLSVEAGTQPNVLVVPSQAVMIGQQGSYVYVVDPRTRTARQRNVAAGRVVSGMTIVERGLEAGDQVVTDGQARLKPGAKVNIVRGEGGSGGASGASGSAAGSEYGAYSGAGPAGAGGSGAAGSSGAAGAGEGVGAGGPGATPAARGTGAPGVGAARGPSGASGGGSPGGMGAGGAGGGGTGAGRAGAGGAGARGTGGGAGAGAGAGGMGGAGAGGAGAGGTGGAGAGGGAAGGRP